jgi:predicted AlkP superfamily pyrophosphatase or phosphodiesterase
MRKLQVVLALLFVITIQTGVAQNRKPTRPPKLVVGIVVDQMRYDYIYKYWDKLGPDGFRRLVQQGFVCQNANFNYVPTYTAPGHASIFTGTTPAVNGIIGNHWFLRDENRGMYCTEDPSVQTVGSTSDAGKMSPRNMLSNTIGDELRMFTNMQSKVVGIALKDRGAILPAGHLANSAYWFDGKNGAFISSTFYMQALPNWVDQFNGKNLAQQYLSKPWNTLLPIAQYTESLPDNNPYESPLKGEAQPVFPHNLPELAKNAGYDLIRDTPFGNSITKDFAIAALRGEQLGKGPHTDMLTVSFSSTDYIGHKFGPGSIEVQDTYLRLDKDIAELLKFLDSHVGKNNVVVFLTADHGAADVPAYMMERRQPAGYFDNKVVVDSLKKHLSGLYGAPLVQSYYNQQVFLDHAVLSQRKLNKTDVQNEVADFLLRFPGIANTITANALNNNYFGDGMRNLVQNGFSQTRSGDVVVTYSPAWMEFGKTGTTHGSSYSYDTRVPLIWYGWEIQQGSSPELVHISDIAPTLAIFLNTQFPNGTTGKPIPFLRK